ncbi:MAG: hypothetical protein WA668_04190 [Candidatus Cybelea sp.]
MLLTIGWAGWTIAGACAIAPGAPSGGCDPPQPASIAAATQLVSA